MTTNTRIPTTQNVEWGFWGTMNEHAAAAWPNAMTAIAQATGAELDATRIFLDSRHGRHFADDVSNRMLAGHTLADAIHTATTQWMTWCIGRHTAREYGIPRGLPYLTGFVTHCEIVEDSLAA